MRSFIFVTSEGSTFQPNPEQIGTEIDNLQVLGFSEGRDDQHAFENLLKENAWVGQTTFNEILCIELLHLDYQNNSTRFYIKQTSDHT